ncbi:MAG: (E)-4-hydroxy-3-methylbut-2-enyl-diphosphate synthase [Bacteroidota bacterium]|nr:(E)-4-hydroxy-3-methylbut-2-enyl-diphosphate synthase [Bacteroidota bacterium]
MTYFPFVPYITREVKIGNITLGGDNPVRLQSMTNTNTMDTEATVAQSIRMIEAGSELIRITAPGVKEAKHLGEIKKELLKKGYNVPIIADIHFNPKAAEEAAKVIEKIRINPGNYIDRNRKDKIEFTEEEYNAEVKRIKERITPLITICKKHNTAIRIGSNHGSLSQRIMSRYGDTAIGMAESAMEFLRICNELDFHNIVVSMKSSNTRVMIHATRLIVVMMQKENLNYPIHLGVTEAGAGDEGRIKSATGISTLLNEGIGDTIRVSLTEAPEIELPAAKSIIAATENTNIIAPATEHIFDYEKKYSNTIETIGGDNPPIVIVTSEKKIAKQELIPDGIFHPAKENSFLLNGDKNIAFTEIFSEKEIPLKIKKDEPIVLSGDLETQNSILKKLQEKKNHNPIILRKKYSISNHEEFIITAASEIGGFLVNGLIDGIWIENNPADINAITNLSFSILQASRSRISRTEYIACPSCGRTQYNIVDTLKKIEAKTSHLKGLKIGVMGCIVNGPGEMADADYGYVGAGKGLITLYKKKEVMKQNIPEADAIDELIALLKANNDWEEKSFL